MFPNATLEPSSEPVSGFPCQDPTKMARFARDLSQMKPSEELSKAGIANMLSQAITTQHLLYASLGSAEFMEFVLTNPFNVPQTVTIHSDDPELRYDSAVGGVVVFSTDKRELLETRFVRKIGWMLDSYSCVPSLTQ